MICHLKRISAMQWHHLIKLRNEKNKTKTKGIFLTGPHVLVKWVHFAICFHTSKSIYVSVPQPSHYRRVIIKDGVSRTWNYPFAFTMGNEIFCRNRVRWLRDKKPLPWHLTALVAANGRPLFLLIYIHGVPTMCHTLCQVPWGKQEKKTSFLKSRQW